MIVLDASVVVELLLGTQAADSLAARILGETPWHAPAVLDLEVANAIRRLCTIHETSNERGSRAIGDLGTLPVRRYPHTPLLDRIWQLRPNLTAYDAAQRVHLDAPLHVPGQAREQLGEVNVLLGTGIAKISAVMQELHRQNFAGLVAVEYEKEGDVNDDMRRQDMEFARRLA